MGRGSVCVGWLGLCVEGVCWERLSVHDSGGGETDAQTPVRTEICRMVRWDEDPGWCGHASERRARVAHRHQSGAGADYRSAKFGNACRRKQSVA